MSNNDLTNIRLNIERIVHLVDYMPIPSSEGNARTRRLLNNIRKNAYLIKEFLPILETRQLPPQIFSSCESNAEEAVRCLEAFFSEEKIDNLVDADEQLSVVQESILIYAPDDKVEQATIIAVARYSHKTQEDDRKENQKDEFEKQKDEFEKQKDEYAKQKDELEKQKNEYANLKDELEKQIKDADKLVSATFSVGLTEEYQKTKKEFTRSIVIHSVIFYLSIITIFIVLTNPLNWSWVPKNNDTTTFLSLITQLAQRISLLFPFIWLAIFSSKRRSEAYRMLQEYSHKRNVIAMFVGLKEDARESENLEELTSVTIKTIGFNPSEALDKKSKTEDKHLLQSVIDTILEGLKKLKNKN